MRCVKADLDDGLKEIQIEIFSDLHIGSKKCDYAEIKNRIDKVMNNDNCFAVFLGDIVNNSILGSVAQADLFESDLSPMMQMQKAIDLFKPMADAGKILAVTSGNHERRSYKSCGMDLMMFFCRELEILDRYDYTSVLLFLRFGHDKRHAPKGKQSRKISYSIYLTHGDGQGGRTIGSRANGLQRRGQIVDADVVITGHTHSPISFRDSFYRIDYQNSCVRQYEQLLVNASATIDYESYAEMVGMKPNSKVSPIIVLSGTKKFAKTII